MQGKTGLSRPRTLSCGLASMRPPRNAGENGSCPNSVVESGVGFNEAPAKCRGKRGEGK